MEVRNLFISWLTPDYKVAAGSALPKGTYSREDNAREKIHISLALRASGFKQPTDIQFLPGNDSIMIILEKGGRAYWFNRKSGERGLLFQKKVRTVSEMGLLGLAFHPDFKNNGKFYINYNPLDGKMRTRIAALILKKADPLIEEAPGKERVIFEILQPYSNHNAGQLAFGPDGYLYLGLGDGGWANDRHGHGQNTMTFLGSMLRLNINKTEGRKAYAVPLDNPFVGRKEFLPEIFAFGLRNPWRYSFDASGRLILADVGQDTWEEVNIIQAGANYGWNVREAAHCFRPEKKCQTKGLTEPIYEYSHREGNSITGGYVYLGQNIPALKGKYVFGDFVQGKIWALDLPGKNAGLTGNVKAYTLGKWNILISTFGRDASGEIYLADFQAGNILQIVPVENR
jgi:glucose/arabinose dehydrogenase